jgi:hypothetical protein
MPAALQLSQRALPPCWPSALAGGREGPGEDIRAERRFDPGDDDVEVDADESQRLAVEAAQRVGRLAPPDGAQDFRLDVVGRDALVAQPTASSPLTVIDSLPCRCSTGGSGPAHRRVRHLGPAGSTHAHCTAAPPSPHLTSAAGPAARTRPVMAYSGNRRTSFRPVSFGAVPVRSRSESVPNRTSKGTNDATSPDQDQVPAVPNRVGQPADHRPHDCPNMVSRLAVAKDPTSAGWNNGRWPTRPRSRIPDGPDDVTKIRLTGNGTSTMRSWPGGVELERLLPMALADSGPR